jgi:TetR/AcrR family transcriptional repressor of mexJK operon
MVSAGAKTVREGSASKRAAILAAARELFLAEGYERTSVDAVSARAQVSKRTVYDYFGDKRALLLAVVEQSAESLLVAVQAAVDEELADGRDLEAALTAFAVRVATSTFGSADYAALLRLVQAESAHLPELRDHRLATAPEEAVAERLAAFGRAGLLEVPDPLLAADHFVALTFMLAQNKLGPALGSGRADGEQLLVAGVRAFLRAYAPRERV